MSRTNPDAAGNGGNPDSSPSVGRRPLLRTGALAAVAALLLGTVGPLPAALAAPDDEGVWEEGIVTSIADGDTLNANLANSSGPLGNFRIRTIGVQAPEVAHSGKIAECGSAEATDRLRATFPVGSAIQTRSVSPESRDDYTNGRIIRSLYARDSEGNWYDSSRQTMRDGWMMWLPLAADNPTKAEWAHNLEYRVLADKAAAEKRGLWTADLCGPSPAPDANLRVWAQYYGTERVYVQNDGPTDVDLSGWTIRDSAASGYRTLPPGTVVPAGEVREVYSGQMNLNNLPADNKEFEGDALYLLDNAGPYATGNLRAWFPYPCNPDDCTDPLAGQVSITRVQAEDPPLHAPSAPGSLSARATTDGSGDVHLQWAAPHDLGGPGVGYSIGVSSDGGDEVRRIDDVTGTSHTITGLDPGHAYTFEVRATNGAGHSAAARTTRPVTPTGPAKPPVADEPAQDEPAQDDGAPEGGDPRLADDPGADDAPAADASPRPERSASPARAGHQDAPPSSPPPTVADPWVGGEFVDITNRTGSTATLGGYGFWNTASSDYVNPGNGDREDRAAYLFPADATLAAGQTLRVHFGEQPASSGPTSGAVQHLWTGAPDFIGATGDYVELAHLNRAQVDCQATAGGTCRGTTQQSIATPPVGVTARSTPSEVSVAWGAPISRGGTAITGYTATAYDSSIGGNPIASCSTDGSARGCSFPASIGRQYHVEVVAHNAQGTSGGSWRVLAAPRTAPSAPAWVDASGANGGMVVSWGPAAANGAAITGYTASAYLSPSGGAPVASCTTRGDELGCTIPGLKQGTPYFVSVTATNRAGTSPETARVAAAPAGRPSAVTTYSGGKVTVRWDAPAPGSSVTTGYSAAVYTKASGGTRIGTCTASAGRTSCTTGKLPKRSRYYVTLTQNTTAGAFTLPQRIETGPARVPSAPKVVRTAALSQSSSSKVTVAWSPPASHGFSPLKGYQARLYSKSKGGSVKASCSTGPTSTACTTKSLRKGTYYASVRVKNGKGWSSWSPRVKVVVR